MKYELSFCEITQLSDNIFESVDKEGIVIDKKCSYENYQFWDELRSEPFGLLINCKNLYSITFQGAQTLGSHKLQYKTATLLTNSSQATAMKTFLSIKESIGIPYKNHKFFTDRNEALEWLKAL